MPRVNGYKCIGEFLKTLFWAPFFIVYVDDLPQVIQNSAVTQYANDTTMALVTNDVNLLVIDTLTLLIFPLSPLPAEQ